MKRQGPTTAQEILLAASELSGPDRREFSEWDLTVKVWRANRNKFGARGYEAEYPDHKRVMMDIMTSKKDNPLRRGWIERVRPNYYRITALGLAEASAVNQVQKSTPAPRSSQVVYDAVERFTFHPVFRRHLNDFDEPKTWLGLQSFLALRHNSAAELDDALRRIRDSVARATDVMNQEGTDVLRSGSVGGRRSILRVELEKLLEFLVVLEERFSLEITALRRHAGSQTGPVKRNRLSSQ